MSSKHSPPDEAAGLRRRAEERARADAAGAPAAAPEPSPEATRRLLHELQVHQIELELQNEELRRAQVELDVARARYFDLYELAPIGYLALSEGGFVLAANLTLAGLLGVERRALLEQPLSHFILPDDQDVYYRHRQRLFQTGAPQTCEVRMRRAGAAPFWARVAASAAPDPDGATRCLAVVSDVSEYKAAQEEAARRQRLIDAILEHAPIGFAVNTIDDGVARFVSARFEEIYGLPRGAVRNVSEFFDQVYADPADRELVRAQVLADVASGDPARMRWENLVVSSAAGAPRVVTATNIPLPEQNLMISTVQDVTARHRIEAALRASEQELANALQMARAGHWEYDVDRDQFTFNDSFYRIFRTTAAAVGGYTMSAAEYARRFCHPDDAPQVAIEMQAALDTTDPDFSRETEHRILFADGSVGHIAVRYFIVKDRQGRTVKTFGVNQDITERRRMERALRESEERFRSLVDNTGEGIGIVDLEDRFAYANRAAESVFGVPPGALVGRSLSEFVSAEDFASFAWITHERPRGASNTYQLDIRRPDGAARRLLVTTTTRFDDQERPQGSYGVFRDVTEPMKLEGALRQSEARFRALFDNVTDGLLLTDLESGCFTMANQAMCHWLGYEEAELLGRRLQDIHPGDLVPEIDAAFARMAGGGSDAAHDVPFVRRDGTTVFADVSGTRVILEGRPFVLGSFRDVTEKRRLQASLAQSDRLASMGMLAAGVAHEINNPLSYVLFNVESLAEDLPRLAGAVNRCGAALRARVGDAEFAALAGDAADLLQPVMLEDAVDRAREALEGAQRIKAISRGLGTFARVERVECAAVDLNGAIEHAATMAQNEIKYRARLVKDLGPVPAVWASAGKLSQVFLNLLINAAHATPEGDAERHRIGVRTWSEDGAVLAEVTDTGAGIPPENLERIFEPFFTTKKVGEGSGLGLAICRNIITGFGGTLRVESQVGRGTRFIVRLPLPRGAAGERDEPAAGAPPARAPTVRGRLLVVDDEAAIRRTLVRLLGAAHEVVTAASGMEAQAILERDRAFDVILCDLMMPELSGMELHEWLAQADPALARQVVFVTGGAFTPRASEYVASVGNLRIEKPFEAVNLAKLVAELVVAARSRR